MFPPVDERVLRDNPEFAKMYGVLESSLLNLDGSSRYHESVAERDSIKQALSNARIIHAKKCLLEEAIDSTSMTQSSNMTNDEPDAQASKSDSLADLIVLLPLLLDEKQPVDPGVADLILSSPPFTDIRALLPGLGKSISASLQASVLNIARIVHPSTNPSFLHRHISSLPSDLSSPCKDLLEAQTTLLRKRLEVQVLLTDLLHIFTDSLAMLIQSLETKHGLALRNLELRALSISLDAQQVEVDAKATLTRLTKEMYSPETIAALENYSSHLRDAQVRAAERVRCVQAELAGYGVGTNANAAREQTMRDLAQKYRETENHVEEVKRDLDRLDQRAPP